MELIPAVLKDEAFLADVIEARQDKSALHTWWLGQSGFLCCSGEKTVLFDPYLSDSLTRKYAGTDKEHVRMTELVIEPGRLDVVDVVTSSHNHTDHLDAETLNPLREANSNLQMVIPEANRAFIAERLGCDADWLIGFNDGSAGDVGGVTFHGLPAAHNQDERDDEGNCKFMGYVAQWNGWSVYHSGDTRPIPGLAARVKALGVDLALLPINGKLESRRVAGNLWGQEAAALAHDAGAQCVIPCHYDMFTFNTVTPKAFVEACALNGQDYKVLCSGERVSLSR